MSIRRWWRYYYLRLLRIRGRPEEIARGLAVGVFVGLTPFLGLHTVLSLLLASMFKANQVAAVAATWVGNPLTLPVIYLAEFKLGQAIVGSEQVVALTISGSWQGAASIGMNILLATILGSLVLGLMVSLATYFLFRDSIYLIRLRRGLARLAR